MINSSCVQELLCHPFLRPTAPAPAAAPADRSLVGLTREQLRRVLAQVTLTP